MELGFVAVMVSFVGLALCVHAFFKQKEYARRFPRDAPYDPLTRAGRRRDKSRKEVAVLWTVGAGVSMLGLGLGIAAAATAS